MLISEIHSYRHAEAILDKEFPQEKKEILEILGAVPFARKDKVRDRVRKGKLVSRKSIDQVATNKEFERAFGGKSWEVKPRIISASASRLEADYKKGKIQVEIQFGNRARWYTHVFKFLLSNSAADVEVGILFVAMQ